MCHSFPGWKSATTGKLCNSDTSGYIPLSVLLPYGAPAWTGPWSPLSGFSNLIRYMVGLFWMSFSSSHRGLY